MILTDSTRDWPCTKCKKDIKVAFKSKEDIKSDGTFNLEVNNTLEESISNFESGVEQNSRELLTNLTAEELEESSVDPDSGAKKSENDSGVQVSIEQSIAAPDLYECEKCILKFITYKGLINHGRVHRDINLYECERCGKEFRLGSKYRHHSLNHKSDTPFICQFCNKGFKSLRLLRQHELTHKKDKILPCPHCDKTFCHKKALKQHLDCLKEKQIECTMCDKKFQYNSHLKTHIDLVHGQKRPPKSQERKSIKRVERQKRFACEKCGKLMSTEADLKMHNIIKHTELKGSFPCSYCSKSFYFSNSLICHMQHHINSKNIKLDSKIIESYLKYKCDECDKAFTTQSFLTKHKGQKHSGAKYICAHCGKKFTFKNYLVLHLRLVHDSKNPRNFVCSICRKVSVNKWAFESHMLSHTGETPFHCTFCDSKYRYKKSLRIHMSNKHVSKS